MIDTYLNVKEGFSILKYVLENEEKEVKIPPFLKILRDVSKDLGYKA
jgi:hypothetical protein